MNQFPRRSNPENALKKARKARLARTEGTIISGLPFVTTPFAEINLFSDKIEFSVFADRNREKRQNFNLDLNKITKVLRQANTQNTQIVSQTANNTVISGTYSGDGCYHDVLVFEYLDKGEEKRIVVNLPPMMSGVSKFMREYEKLKPQSDQTIEL